ncbi:MAG: hypothetical protein JNL95_03925 [Chitinophagales bacterium]|nr:hypothetical protein [Chitinophagales bacterium]
MATSSYSISFDIQDLLLGKNIKFSDKKIEIWKKEESYDELLGTVSTNSAASATFSFSLNHEGDAPTISIYLKISDRGKLITYHFYSTNTELLSISSGSTASVVIVDLNEAYTEVKNDLQIINAVLTDELGTPYSELKVKITLQNSDISIQSLGETRTNPLGFFSFSFVKDKKYLSVLANPASTLNFKFEYFDPNNNFLDSQMKTFATISNLEDLLILKKNLPDQVEFVSSSVASLATLLEFTIPGDVTTLLTDNNLSSLRDIRAIGGLKRLLPGSSVTSLDTINLLDAHAQLETLSGDYKSNHAIIDKGYNAVYKIAITPSDKFVKDVSDKVNVGQFEALKVHRIASAHSKLYNSVFTAAKVDQQYAFSNPLYQGIIDEINDKCNCDDCEASISPIAYLADLLWYAKTHLTIQLDPKNATVEDYTSGASVTVEMLRDLLCQSFCLDEEQCDIINKKLCQYQVAIETLNCYREWLSPNLCQTRDFATAERNFIRTTYSTLLEQLGTSYFEVRDAKNSGDEKRKKELAQKIGIVYSLDNWQVAPLPTYTNTIDALCFDVYDSSITNEYALIYLETIFGFRRYTRSCSDETPVSMIQEWKELFARESWITDDKNTDVYSVPESGTLRYIIDPDTIGPDDFRFPVDSNRAFGIWENRKKYIDKIWSDVFYNPSNWTPKGVVASSSDIYIAGDITSKLKKGVKLRIIDSPGNEGLYTVDAFVYNNPNTSITLVEEIKPLLSGQAKIVVSVEFGINSIANTSVTINSSTFDTAVITLNSAPDDIANDSFIELIENGGNNGFHKVINVSGANVRLDKILTTQTAAGGKLRSTITYAILDTPAQTVSKNYVVVNGDFHSIIDSSSGVEIIESSSNNNIYPVDGLTLISGNTQIRLDLPLKSTKEDGKVRFTSIAYGKTITANLGARKLILNLPNGTELFSTGNPVEIKPKLGSPFSTNYTVISVASAGAYTTVEVNNAISGSEVGGRLIKTFTSVSVNANVFTLENLNLESSFDLNDPERNKVEIDGKEYLLLSVNDNGSDTDFTVDANPSIVTGAYVVKLFFIIKEVDTSGKGFTFNTQLPSEVAIGDKLIIDTTDGDVDGVYTITAINGATYDVAEIVQKAYSGTLTENVYFKKVVPILYTRPKLDVIFAAMKSGPFVSYTSTPTVTQLKTYPWALSTLSVSSFVVNKELLVSATSDIVITSLISTIKTSLNLNRDEFIRLANIYEKYTIELADPNAPRVTEEEYVELFNILIKATKNAKAQDWINEENASTAVKLNYSDFWISLTEPVEGTPNIYKSDLTPFIDPDLMGLSKLPDFWSSKQATVMYNNRRDALNEIKELIKQVRLSYGFDQMLKIGLGGVNGTDSFPFNLEQQLQKLSSINIDEVDEARRNIETQLFLNEEDFRVVMQLKARQNTSNPPSLDEYQKLYGILAKSYKRRVLYPQWVLDEGVFVQGSPAVYEHWRVTKAKLTKWRTSTNLRVEWQNALIARNTAPVVEPDLVFPEDFSNYNSPAYNLWSQRRSFVTTTTQQIATDIQNSTNLNQYISQSLSIDITEYDFELLVDMDVAGIDIRPNLKQLLLSYQAFKRLKALVGVSYSNMTPSERGEFVSILVQVKKVRDEYATWRDEESAQTIFIDPTHFQVNKPKYGESDIQFYEKLDKWRVTWKERRAWEKKLRSRIAQLGDISTMMENVLETVNNQVLPIIRDGLVMLCGNEYDTLQDNAKMLERRLLVDFSINCCQHVTRVSHAIDVIQKLLWTESVGIDKDVQLNSTVSLEFELNAPYFEEEWKWLGSYSTWRAAMFVFMYPENLLLPSLRRFQSPAFAKLVKDVRLNNRLTPLDACRAAKEYSYYFEDIAALEAESSCNTKVRFHKEECLNAVPLEKVDTLFLFATRKRNDKDDERKVDNDKPRRTNFAYYHTKRLNGNSNTDFSYWMPIQGLGENVVRIVGSAVYEQDPDTRHLYVFAIIYEDLNFKLVFTKYDLEQQHWDTDYTEMSMPEDVDYSSIMLWICKDEKVTPELIYKGKSYRAIFMNQLNQKAKDWDKDEWEIISPAGTSKKYATTINAYLTFGPGKLNDQNERIYERILIGSNDANQIWYKLVGENDDLRWRPLVDKSKLLPKSSMMGTTQDYEKIIGEFKGAFNYDVSQRKVQVLFNQSGVQKQVVISPNYINRSYQDSNNRAIYTFTQLNNWLTEVGDFGLSDITLHAEHSDSLGALKWTWEERMKPANLWYNYLYHRSIYNRTDLLNEFKGSNLNLLLQAYQCLWDSDLEETTGAKGITQKVNNAITWLCKNYIEKFNKDDVKAADLKWVDQVFKQKQDSPLIFYSPTADSSNWGGDPSVQTILDALLQHSVAAQNMGNKLRTGEWGAWLAARKLWNQPSLGLTSVTIHHDAFIYAYMKVVCMVAMRHDDGISSIMPFNQSFDFIRHYNGSINKSIAVEKFDGYDIGISVLNTSLTSISGEDYVKLDLSYQASPQIPSSLLPITEELTNDELGARKGVICLVNIANTGSEHPAVNLEYLREATYFVPMFLGIQLSQRGQYEAALKWFKTVYNYKQDIEEQRLIYSGLKIDEGSGNNIWQRDMADWLLDPLNPHTIALSRANSYYKYTVSTIAQTFNAYANAQFTLDTVESVSKAKELYQFAAELLSIDILKQKPKECFIDWNEVKVNTKCLVFVSPAFPRGVYELAIDNVFDVVKGKVNGLESLNAHNDAVRDILITNVGTETFDLDNNLAEATEYVNNIEVSSSTISLNSLMENASTQISSVNDAVMTLGSVEKAGLLMRDKIGNDLKQSLTAITSIDSKTLEKKTTTINWVTDPKKEYKFDVNKPNEQNLVKEHKMRFGNITSNTASVVSSQMHPQEALDAINAYPFPYIPSQVALFDDFCVPVNPTYQWLSMSIELNLFKIRNCMNIAGMKRELEPYAAPTDLYSGLPQIGANGQISLPGTATIRPTIYRYKFLLERAKQLIGMAQQVESAFLQTLEKLDAEKYNLLRAKQDLSIAKATVKLKELQVKVSEAEVDMAYLQKERSEIQVQELDNLINAGLNEFESQMIEMYWASASMQAVIAGLDFGLGIGNIVSEASTMDTAKAISKGAYIGIYSTLASIRLGEQIGQAFVQAGINVNSIRASQARREQEWNFQKTMAQQDIKIGGQQVKIAQDRVRVSEQDRKISELQVSNAEASIDFLNNKFTNVDLYDWMSRVLEPVFSWYVSEATGIAKLAENQLAFERQEPPAGIIQGDYWILPADGGGMDGGTGPNRRGLTSSVRMSMDIDRLVSYAMNTEQRKLQITKTLSLASIAPMEFQQLKESGQITFDTLMDYFDRDFPGQYLRLIKKVRVNVVALVPPTQGIKATLTSSGISHVVISGNGGYQDVLIRRSPETIVLSGNRESNGSFELQQVEGEMMFPFESTGVHSRWQFKMEKPSNMFDFNTIADVLITIDYTALSSYDYEKQVKSSLGTEFSSDRAFSFRNEFSDAFYQWTHLDEFGTDGTSIKLDISKFDFPANVADLGIDALKFYAITDQSDPMDLVFDDTAGKGVKVVLTPLGDATSKTGESVFNSKGIISTLTNAGSLAQLRGKNPVGNWEITLKGLDDALKAGKLIDLIMVITYSGETPRWL